MVRRSIVLWHFIRWLVALGVIVAGAVGTESATANSGPACKPLSTHLATGSLPHRTFSLHTERFHNWFPIVMDSTHILMGLGLSRESMSIRSGHLALVHLPSTRLLSVPRGAVPRLSHPDEWQLDWPWIVGIATASGLPAFPANWRLWAGNLVTGKHIILDNYRAHHHPVAEFYPHIAVSAGRVAWVFSSNRTGDGGFPAERIALANLSTGHRTFLTSPDPHGVVDRITFSGTRIVWEAGKVIGRHPADVWLYDLGDHKLTRLSRNVVDTSSSLYPRLSGRYLLFEQGPYGSNFGTPYLVDLASRRGKSSREWWHSYRFWQLDSVGTTTTQMGNGLVSWTDHRLLDVTRARIWKQHVLIGKGAWLVGDIAGRTVLVHDQEFNTGRQTYAVWEVPRACMAKGFATESNL